MKGTFDWLASFSVNTLSALKNFCIAYTGPDDDDGSLHKCIEQLFP